MNASPLPCSVVIPLFKRGKRIAAQVGKAGWEVLDPSWTLKENGSGVEPPKPLYLN